MHIKLLEEIVKVCRQREAEGDCPTVEAPGRETLEFAVIDLADQLDKMKAAPVKRAKHNYVGAPAIFKLEQACQVINDAFNGFGCYLVGSALERPDWRDVDVRFIMPDADFAKEFPRVDLSFGGNGAAYWEFDPKWLLLTTALSDWLQKATGLPVDFQFQPQTWANARHGQKQGKRRNAIGLRMAPAPEQEAA